MNKRLYLFLPLLLLLQAFYSDKTLHQKRDDLVYRSAFKEMFSQSPYYIVITVKNKNTGEVKELCTQPAFLDRALSMAPSPPTKAFTLASTNVFMPNPKPAQAGDFTKGRPGLEREWPGNNITQMQGKI